MKTVIVAAMKKATVRAGAFGLAVLSVTAFGCGGEPTAKKDDKATPAAASGQPGEKAEKKGDDSAGWWCSEHGIPEHDCSMCSAKVAKDFKAKGDWCDKHDRAKSQCFICDPSLEEKFAATYRAKYGKEPPAIEPEKDEKGEKK
jgi:hypothetical protein